MTTSTTDVEAIARIIRLAMYDSSASEGPDELSRIAGTYATTILSYLASRREAVTNDDIANALEKCDWSGASIGNKAIISAAVERLRENVLFCQDATDHLALIDYISDKIGLPKDQELSRENFVAWLAASRREAQEPVAWVMPGDDNARDNGFIDAMAWREGEFTKPLYTAPPAPAGDLGATYSIEHDGFIGTVIGSYTTREGKEGVVLQQVGTKVAHVYGRKWLKTPEAAPAGEVERLRPEEILGAEILTELTRARANFPGKNVTFAALIEEVGELATATFEESRDRVRKEAVQVAVMAMRMVLDGDHTFDDWRASKGLDCLVSAALDGGQHD